MLAVQDKEIETVLKERLRFCRQVMEQLLWEEYRVRLEVPVTLNKYLRTTQARLWLVRAENSNKPVLSKTRVEFNPKILLRATKEYLRNVARHEAVHYGLMIQGKPFLDGTVLFESEIKRLGIPSNFGEMTIEDEEHVKQAVQKTTWYYCECVKCGRLAKVWKRKPQESSVTSMKRYRTSCCRERLLYRGGESAGELLDRVQQEKGK